VCVCVCVCVRERERERERERDRERQRKREKERERDLGRHSKDLYFRYIFKCMHIWCLFLAVFVLLERAKCQTVCKPWQSHCEDGTAVAAVRVTIATLPSVPVRYQCHGGTQAGKPRSLRSGS
jgi:hypothetical protein